ncbi:MAG: D-alanine--D-alanine ligase [Planctomycetota bacterium]
MRDKHRLLKLLNTKQLRIGVLYGGFSSERPISLKSGKAVAAGLRSLGYPVKLIDIKSPGPAPRSGMLTYRILAGLKTCDAAFIALHGKFGEDGQLQKLLDKHHIPYTGSGSRASLNAMDKFATKRLFAKHRIPSAPFKQLRISDHGFPVKACEALWKWKKLVVKPRSEGSSVGVSISCNADELYDALKLASRYGRDILLEQYISGREVTVGILGNKPLPVIEMKPYKDFFSYKAKYKDDKTQYIVNPDFPKAIIRRIQRTGLKAYQALGCKGFSRVDLIYSAKDKKAYVLEVNSIPGMTERSLVPKAARAIGIGFPQLCKKIIELSL